jgi:hypothetical protein
MFLVLFREMMQALSSKKASQVKAGILDLLLFLDSWGCSK